MSAETATETAPAPTPSVRPIVVDILAAHESWAYLLHPEMPVRPATAAELEAVEVAAYADYKAAMASKAAVGTAPRGPWPVTRAPAPEPEPAAVTVTDQPAGPAQDAPAAPQTIRDVAADRLGVAAPDKAADEAFAGFTAAFAEDPEGEGDRAQPDTTAVMPAAEQHTEAIEAVANEDHEGAENT